MASLAPGVGMNDQGGLLAAYWAQATPAGRCSVAMLEKVLPKGLPALPLGDGDGKICRDDFLLWLFGKVLSEEQGKVPSLRELCGEALKVRASTLMARARDSMRPSLEAAWPQGGGPPDLSDGRTDEKLWQECLVALGAANSVQALAGNHFAHVVEAGLDANAVRFPHKVLRPGKLSGMLTPMCELAMCDANAAAFPPLGGSGNCFTSWADGAEKESGEAWMAGLARSPEELRGQLHSNLTSLDMALMPWPMSEWGVIMQDRCLESQLQILRKKKKRDAGTSQWCFERKQAKMDPGLFEEARFLRGQMHRSPKTLDMVVEPWPMKEERVIVEDRCTEAQLLLLERRSKHPPSQKLIERRRAKVANPRFWEEVRPALEREASLAEMHARWARDRALEARLHDEAAERGAAAVAWPTERHWPTLPAAWSRHAVWFAMWRKTQMDQLAQLAQARSLPMAPGNPPKLKRSLSEKSWEALSECSDSSWQAISDDNWQEVGSMAMLEARLSGEPAIDLEEAKLKLAEAKKACDCLSKNSIAELKCLAKPPVGVSAVCCAVGLLLGFGARVKDWKGCQKMMNNPQAFLLTLKAFDAKCIPAGNLRKVRVIMQEPFFKCDAMMSKSVAAASFVNWVINIVEYNLLHSKIASQPGAIEANQVLDDGAQVPSRVEAQAVEEVAVEEVAASAEEVASLLEAAKDGLTSLRKGDIVEVKGLNKPPPGVALTMQAVCVLFGLKPVKKLDPQNPRKYVFDYWQTSKALLGDATFLKQLLEFDRDKNPSEVIVNLTPYIARADFAPEAIQKVSKACAGICKWVHAMYKYSIAKEAMAKAAAAANKEQNEIPNAKALAAEKPKEDKAKPGTESVSFSDAANDAWRKVTKADLGEMKSLGMPPVGVCLTMEAVCIMLSLEDASSWSTAKKVLANVDTLMHKLQAFDNDNIPSGVIVNIAPLVARADFAPEAIKKVCVACEPLCTWVHAVYKYHSAKEAVPKVAVAADDEHTSTVPEPLAMESPRKETSPPSPYGGSTAPPSPDAAAWLSSGSALSSPTSPQRPSSAPTARRFGGLDKKDLVELKAMARPPQPVMMVCVCVAVLQPLGKEDPDKGWKGVKDMLSDPCLLKAMQEYRRENASEEQLRRVRELLETDECFKGENLKAVSKAAYGLLEWVRAVVEDIPLPSQMSTKRRSPEATKWAWLVSGGAETCSGPFPHELPWKPC